MENDNKKIQITNKGILFYEICKLQEIMIGFGIMVILLEIILIAILLIKL